MKKYLLLTALIILKGCTMSNLETKSNNKIVSKVPEIPLEDFFRNPEKSSFQLSPEGGFISYMKPWEEGNRRMNIFVKSMSEDTEIQLTKEKDRSIYGYFWLSEDRIAYAKDEGGDENIHIFAVNTDGSNEIDLTPFENIKAEIIDDLEDDPMHMVIGLNKRDVRIHDAYRLNVNTGEMALIAENPGNISSWMTDNKGQLRIATTSDGVNESLLYRDNEETEFKTILTTNFKESVSPLYFTFDDKELYVSSNRYNDKSSIYKLSV